MTKETIIGKLWMAVTAFDGDATIAGTILCPILQGGAVISWAPAEGWAAAGAE